jgi:hypothetical protein
MCIPPLAKWAGKYRTGTHVRIRLYGRHCEEGGPLSTNSEARLLCDVQLRELFSFFLGSHL